MPAPRYLVRACIGDTPHRAYLEKILFDRARIQPISSYVDYGGVSRRRSGTLQARQGRERGDASYLHDKERRTEGPLPRTPLPLRFPLEPSALSAPASVVERKAQYRLAAPPVGKEAAEL